MILPFSLKPPLAEAFQSHGQQQEHCVDAIEYIRPDGHPVPDDLRIVVDPGLIQHQSCRQSDEAGEQHDYQTAIPVVKAIDGLGCPAAHPAAPALHGKPAFEEAFQRPGNQDRQLPHPVFHPLPETALMHAPADASLGRFDLGGPHPDSTKHPQRHRQHERKPRRDLSKKIDDLVHGKHLQKAAEHHQKTQPPSSPAPARKRWTPG